MSETKQRPVSDSRPQQPNANSNQLEEEELEEEVGNRFLFFQVMPSWAASFFVHVALIILLAVLTFALPKDDSVALRAGDPTPETESMEDMTESFEMADALENTEIEETNEAEIVEEFEDVEVSDVFEENFDVSDIMAESVASAESSIMTDMGNLSPMVGGRSAQAKAQMLQKYGGTRGTENAVKLALEWIAKHQLNDGSWNFDHRIGEGKAERRSPNEGDGTAAVYGATAMALLPFLGAGNTHLSGEYKDVVRKGVEYLKKNDNRGEMGLSFSENQGTMYSHGLATLVLTELYAMSGDTSLSGYAQDAVNYIAAAQDPVGGGWRYNFQDRGDTSVVGWQIMALKSADMGQLEVPDDTIRGARKFLDSVSSGSGSLYGYLEPTSTDSPRPGMTAVGLLCRMYLGWTKENPSLQTGVQFLSRRGPKIGDWEPDMKLSEKAKTKFRCDMYYNYYATQVMRHYGGETWNKWNLEMREFLIASQAQKGHAKGSWWFENPDDLGMRVGGRLYCTSMAAMTLEVYYRYMPLYDTKKTESSEFPLD